MSPPRSGAGSPASSTASKLVDVLVVTKLDRLGRNVMDVGSTVARLAELGVRVHCLALGGVDLTSSTGKLTMNVLNAVAEFERDLLIERTQAGCGSASNWDPLALYA
jgi:putative DNA-invertase from lambdoid prophage Rac